MPSFVAGQNPFFLKPGSKFKATDLVSSVKNHAKGIGSNMPPIPYRSTTSFNGMKSKNYRITKDWFFEMNSSGVVADAAFETMIQDMRDSDAYDSIEIPPGEDNGHIAKLEYSPGTKILIVTFANNGNVVAYENVSTSVYAQLRHFAETMEVDSDGRHLLGKAFWTLVRRRGNAVQHHNPYKHLGKNEALATRPYKLKSMAGYESPFTLSDEKYKKFKFFDSSVTTEDQIEAWLDSVAEDFFSGVMHYEFDAPDNVVRHRVKEYDDKGRFTGYADAEDREAGKSVKFEVNAQQSRYKTGYTEKELNARKQLADRYYALNSKEEKARFAYMYGFGDWIEDNRKIKGNTDLETARNNSQYANMSPHEFKIMMLRQRQDGKTPTTMGNWYGVKNYASDIDVARDGEVQRTLISSNKLNNDVKNMVRRRKTMDKEIGTYGDSLYWFNKRQSEEFGEFADPAFWDNSEVKMPPIKAKDFDRVTGQYVDVEDPAYQGYVAPKQGIDPEFEAAKTRMLSRLYSYGSEYASPRSMGKHKMDERRKILRDSYDDAMLKTFSTDEAIKDRPDRLKLLLDRMGDTSGTRTMIRNFDKPTRKAWLDAAYSNDSEMYNKYYKMLNL